MTALANLPDAIRALAEVIRKHGTCAPAALDHVADELTAALSPAELGGVVSALAVFRIAGGDTECCPNPSAEMALGCLNDLRECYDEALSTPRAAEAEWLPIESAPKGRAVLVRYLNRLGNERVIKARYVERFTEESSSDCDEGVDEYDEANDRYTLCAGWWEMIDNWDDFAFVAVNEGEPTHWHPIPSTAALTPPSAKGE